MINRLEELIKTLPKAELHIHLEGAIRTKTALEIAEKHSRLDFVDSIKKSHSKSTYQGFEDFRDYYRICLELLRTTDDFELAVYEHGQAMFAQNILYSEIYVSIYQHIHLFNKKLSLSDVLKGLERGKQNAYKDFGVVIHWIFGIPRGRHFKGQDPKIFDPAIGMTIVDYAIRGQEHGVIGIGLGGSEVNRPPQPFEKIFKKAKQEGLKSLPHAGETDGANSVWGAINELQADRICHGVRAIEDKKLVKELVERQIPLDICPTSNLCIQLYPSLKAHPFKKLEQAGVIITINSDDPTLFRTTLCDEYIKIATAFDYSISDLARFARNSFTVSFASDSIKKASLQKLDTWEKEHLS